MIVLAPIQTRAYGLRGSVTQESYKEISLKIYGLRGSVKQEGYKIISLTLIGELEWIF